jgi:NADH-quinone oxidoreductase subunit C
MSLYEPAVRTIAEKYPGAIDSVVDFRGERTLILQKEWLLRVAQLLRDDPELRFNMLEDVVADDYLGDEPRFFVSYMLYSIPHKCRLRLRVPVADPDEGPPTLQPLWNIASWLELEVWDLMGITFEGHGGLRRLFLPEDWQGHPLRKDYPLGYEEVQFSFNYERIDARKPYARD